MVDILLTHAYHLPYDPKQVRKMQPYRPLGTLFAAAALRAAGFSVALFDTMLRDPEKEFAGFFAQHHPRILAIYEDDFNFLSKMCLTRMRDVAWHIAAIAKQNDVPIIAHGSDASDHPDLFLSRGIDYILRGEAEESLVTLCRALSRGAKPEQMDGLISRGLHDGYEISARQLAKNPDWTLLPQPPRDLTDFQQYRKAWQQAHGYFSVNMVASRGCPYHCNWCAKPISGNKFHLRAASAVAEEMLQLKTEARAEHIWFSDDVFALNRHWVKEFAVEVTRRDAVIPFKIQSRADLMIEETVEALQSAGCSEVWMGVESGSQKILRAMDKGLLLSDVYSARQTLRRAGIRACFFLQFGYPGEGWRELQETIQLVRNTRPDDIGISFSYPLPGTVFYERVQAQLGSKRNWSDSDDLCIMFHGAYTSEFYRAVRDALHAEVDSWSTDRKHLEASATMVNELWQKVMALEPVSKNPSALMPNETSLPEGPGKTEFIPVHQLSGALGV
ncbi:MAG TPA: radical SAM protein [Terracidiphilus sp.]|nr:radical SAM protein [Terracidiphilus sp.]